VSRLLSALGVLTLALAAAQVLVPRVVSGEMAGQLQALTGPGSRDTVAVDAVPFWRLFGGEFQTLVWTAYNAEAQGLTIHTVSLTWNNGMLDPTALVQDHRLVVMRPGRLSAVLKVDGVALSRFLEASGRLQNAQVTISKSTVHIVGTVNMGGLSGQLDAAGRLAVGGNGQQIVFQPTEVDGYGVPFAANLVVFDVRSLNLPLPVRLTGVRLEPPYVVVTAASP
jgi:hypothetical protein